MYLIKNTGAKERPKGIKPFGLNNPGNNLLSPRRTTIGLTGLASEFGMGSGVSPQVKSPGSLLKAAKPLQNII